MKRALIPLLILFLLAACAQKEARPDFVFGSTQAEVIEQIEKLNGRVLQQSEEIVVAETDHPATGNRVRVEIYFEGGRLRSIDYTPIGGRRHPAELD